MKRIVVAAGVFCGVSSLLSQSPSQVVPDGRRLAPGQYCYIMTMAENGSVKPVGVTFQSITQQQVDGIDALAVVVHQHMFDGTFDMRDSLLLHHDDLRPIRLNSDRDNKPHVHLEYSDTHISGWKMVGMTKQPIDLAVSGPVWDGNLWGVTFAALPLQAGIPITLPIYQYNSGFGSFYLNPLSQSELKTTQGTYQAWTLKAGPSPSKQAEYTVSTQPGLEIGYTAGPSSQKLGGDCTGVQ